jgi:hypothetical protein
MPIGNMLRERGEQYVSNRDMAGTWRILDTWNNTLSELEPEDDIPDDHPSVTILSEGAYHSLIKEAARLGVLKSAAIAENEAINQELIDAQASVRQLNEENQSLRDEVRRLSQSETYLFKESALSAIVKLAALGDVSGLTKKD